MALDKDTHKIYLSVAGLGQVQENVPGSFEVLVYKMN
jgi:hypothetical protein